LRLLALMRMPIAKAFKSGPRKSLSELFTVEQATANLELLKQELSGMEESAAHFFSGFTVPPVGNKPAQWRAWLLASETLEDLKPAQVDYVLKNLDWFKAQIKRKQEVLEDDVPWL